MTENKAEGKSAIERPRISPWSDDPDLRHKFWQILATYLNLIIAIVGIFFVVRSLNNSTKALHNTVQQNMVGLVTQMDRVFVDKPELYPFFYKCQDIDPRHGQYTTATAAAIQMLDLLDIAAGQSAEFPENWNPPEAWDNWIKDQFAMSPILRKTFEQRKSWYSNQLQQRFNQSRPRASTGSECG